jgi:hypothetical protein
MMSLTSQAMSQQARSKRVARCSPLVEPQMPTCTKTEVQRLPTASDIVSTMAAVPVGEPRVPIPENGATDVLTSIPLNHAPSRAIPIKRGRRRSVTPISALADGPGDNDSSQSEDELEMERMYEWSTWRLYHRIVEHRERHPLTASYFNDVENSGDANDSSTSALLRKASRIRGTKVSRPSRASQVHLDKPPLDGEVFEMEL